MDYQSCARKFLAFFVLVSPTFAPSSPNGIRLNNKVTKDLFRAQITVIQKVSGSRYFCESLFWASQPKQAAKT
ncbi:hypothetical protein [Bathymodiolus platifrons methanotrophic gill symbiont]|uniref:hypothetical protein n=1 Tax=Bathymodiolus platifrons methanotrophic gill symbiont TaxID=113268 RepID=UPI001C8ED15F|nr:hypothetical protein [Bathymodiolus platifrons methanotrophic gill symbiont]